MAHKMQKGRILIIATSSDRVGTGSEAAPTGCWLEELATPYYVFKDFCYDPVIASPKGGRIPLDPASVEEEKYLTEGAQKFLSDPDAMAALTNSLHTSQVEDVSRFDAVYIPGGHGAMMDLPNDPSTQRTLMNALEAPRVIASVCHGPAAFTTVKRPADGEWMVKGKKVTAFSNSEERSVGKDKLVPFLLQSKLEEEGVLYTKADDWEPHVVTDGLLVTGQNPASSKGVAEAVIEVLKELKTPPL